MIVNGSSDPQEMQYFCGIKDKAYLWLAARCVAGEPQFKASDVKEKFLSISSTIIEEVCKALVSENLAVIEGRGRVSVYVLDMVKARKRTCMLEESVYTSVLSPPPAMEIRQTYTKILPAVRAVPPPVPLSMHAPHVHSPVMIRAIKSDKRKSDYSLIAGKENGGSSKDRNIQGNEKKTKSGQSNSTGLKDITTDFKHKCENIRNINSSGVTKENNNENYKNNDNYNNNNYTNNDNNNHNNDNNNENDYNSDSEGATSVNANSPPSVLLSNSHSPVSSVCPILMNNMMSVLCFAFCDASNDVDGVIQKSILRQIVTDKVQIVDDEEFNEFLQKMEDENKIMISGEDIYEI